MLFFLCNTMQNCLQEISVLFCFVSYLFIHIRERKNLILDFIHKIRTYKEREARQQCSDATAIRIYNRQERLLKGSKDLIQIIAQLLTINASFKINFNHVPPF